MLSEWVSQSDSGERPVDVDNRLDDLSLFFLKMLRTESFLLLLLLDEGACSSDGEDGGDASCDTVPTLSLRDLCLKMPFMIVAVAVVAVVVLKFDA